MPFVLSLVLFVSGLYLLLSRAHALWLLIGVELMLNAAAPLLIAVGTAEALAVLFLLLFFALLEAGAALFIFYHYARSHRTLSLDKLAAL
ncbi:MAG: NADH-quinone oxidoreductase subunit K [Bacteroidia bacterium]|nr:NADH-quinone oxidoreductase subunit K [Bacteroidia bacterium]MDW8133890.1 NADH-quinone oxidoreductase subunit K [Bacteroidia bacterium]